MKLVRIHSDRVQIKTDSKDLMNLKINDLLLLSDDASAIICNITGLIGNDGDDVYDDQDEWIGKTADKNTIECAILGSLRNGKFTKAIDTYPTTRVDISVIDEGMFSRMISGSTVSSFKLGTYANYEADAMIDGNRLFQRHFAIVGNTGSGKSFALSSLLEKVSRLKGGNVILFDLHGEYAGLNYAKTIRIGNDGAYFPVWFLSFKDIYSSLFRLKEESATLQVSALRKAFYKARESDRSEDIPVKFSMERVIDILREENEEVVSTGETYKTGDKAGLVKTAKGENNGRLTNVISLIEDKLIDKRYSFMSGDMEQDYLYTFVDEIFNIDSGNIKIIDLSGVPHDMIPTVISVVTKLIYSVQLQQKRQDLVPLAIICEEAHVYIPSSSFGLGASERRLLEVFETIAKEGRKFGTTLGIVSQRPSELNKTIMAQCANFIVMKMTNETDREMMKGILPESGRSIIDMLSLFMPGDCLVIGDSANITFKTKIDYPAEPPLSNTIDVWDKWSGEAQLDMPALVNSLMGE